MDNKAKQNHWNKMYERPLENIPWEIASPPPELVNLLKQGIVSVGNAFDIGCGTGNYSIFLAEQGFKVTGVDFSDKALRVARERSQAKNFDIDFIQSDALKLTQVLKDKFNFILDYSLLHHIAPENLEAYAAQFSDLLKPDGILLMVCYSDKDEDAQGQNAQEGKYGNTMFYRPAGTIRPLYAGLRELSYQEVPIGKRGQHLAHCFVFQK